MFVVLFVVLVVVLLVVLFCRVGLPHIATLPYPQPELFSFNTQALLLCSTVLLSRNILYCFHVISRTVFMRTLNLVSVMRTTL